MRVYTIGLLILFSFCSWAQKSMTKLSEPDLITNLQSQDIEIRVAAAKEIRLRIAENRVVVKPGNIIEYDAGYWEQIIKKYKNWTSYSKLEDELNLDKSSRKPNFDQTKAYYLDHHYVLFVEQHKKGNKVRASRLVYSPIFFKDDPPRNFTGLWKTYDINGVIQRETTYNQGKKHGSDIIFHDNGTPCWSKEYFLDSIMEMSHFSENGDLISKKVFDDESRAQWEKDEAQERSMEEEN